MQLNVALGVHPGTLEGVPDVRNLDPASARAKLSAAGFNVQTLRQPVSDPAQVGKVVDEQPRGRNAPLPGTFGKSARRRLYTVLNAVRSLVRGLLVVHRASVAPRLPIAGLGPVAVQPRGVQNGRKVRAGAGAH